MMSDALWYLAVGEPDGPRSSVWRVWTHGDETYVGVRSLLNAFKVSIHKSGQCHAAWDYHRFEELQARLNLESDSRHMAKWEPATLGKLRLAFRVVIADSELTHVRYLDAKRDQIMWLERPGEGRMLEIDFFLTDEDSPEGTWPGSRSMGTKFVGKHRLPDGRMLWCVTLEDEGPDWLAEAKGRVTTWSPEEEAELARHLREKGEVALKGYFLGHDDYGVSNLSEVCIYDVPDAEA